MSDYYRDRSAFGVIHKMYWAAGQSAKDIGGIGSVALKRVSQGRGARLKELEGHGRRARQADKAAKAKGLAGIDPQSRPSFGRKAQQAWDRGWHG